MPHYYIEMGQGMVFDNFMENGVSSGTFYSCSAILMYNNKTGKGGFYHYPSEQLDNQAVVGALSAMKFMIKPIDIIVGYIKPFQSMGTSMMDRKSLESFLTKDYKQAGFAAFEGNAIMSGNAPQNVLTLYNGVPSRWPKAIDFSEKPAHRGKGYCLLGKNMMQKKVKKVAKIQKKVRKYSIGSDGEENIDDMFK